MAKPETVRYEVKCQQEHVATYERKFSTDMQFTRGNEAPLDPVGDAILELAPYKERGRVLGKEMNGVHMIVHMQAYPLNRPIFMAGAKVKSLAPGVETIGIVKESKWSVQQKKWLYKLGADDAESPIAISTEWYSEDLLKSIE